MTARGELFRSIEVALDDDRKVTNDLSNASSTNLTLEEKETVVRQFVRQFLEENPSAALDHSLMSGLNAMTARVVNERDKK